MALRNEFIHVRTKQVYGADLIYPACNEAKLLARLHGTKTLTPDAISIIKQLGYRVVEQTSVEH